MSTLRVIRASCALQVKQSFSRTMFKFCILIHPVLFGWTLSLIYAGQPNARLVSFVLLGTAVSSMWGSISYSSAGDIDRERFMGALPVIFTAPAPFSVVMLGKVLGNTLLGAASMVLSYLFLRLCTPLTLQVAHPLMLAGVLLLGLGSFVGIAMLLSALLALSRSTRVLMNCMDFPVFIFCGIAFPIEILPDWTRPLSYALGPTYLLKLARQAITGIGDASSFGRLLAGLCLVTAAYAAVAWFLYRVLDTRARVIASLEVM